MAVHKVQTVPLDASSIETVTVHQGSAEVTRNFQVNLKDGTNTINITGISSQLEIDSLRVYLSKATSARVQGTTCRVAASSDAPGGLLSDQLPALRLKRKMLESERAARQMEIDLLDGSARSFVNSNSKPDAANINSYLTTFVQRRQDAAKAIADLSDKIAAYDREIATLDDNCKGETNAVITVFVIAERECSTELQLSYAVKGATWKPYYDLHSHTVDGKTSPLVQLRYNASISQSTGEDWRDATLVLGTSSARPLVIPTLSATGMSAGPSIGMFGSAPSSAAATSGSSAPQASGGTLFGAAPTASWGGSEGSATQGGTFAGSGGLFGTAPTTASSWVASGGGNGFGEQTLANAPTPAGGLFGTRSANGSSTAGFGQVGQDTTSASTNGFGGSASLFGRASTTEATPASCGMFGQPSTNTSSFHRGVFVQMPANTSNASGGLFGTRSNASSPSNWTSIPRNASGESGSFFGAPATPANPALSGPFGSSKPSNTSTTSGSILFGPRTIAPRDHAQDAASGSSSTAKSQPATAETQRQTSPTTPGKDLSSQLSAMSIVDRSPVAATYRLRDKAHVASNGRPHCITIACLDLSADIEYVCVPKKSSVVYIHAHIKNTSEYELLAGPVNVFMDKSPVGKTSLPLIGEKESFDCVLGTDSTLKVTYQATVRSTADNASMALLMGSPLKVVTRTTTTTLSNTSMSAHKNIVVRDVIPRGSAFGAMQVMLRKPAGLADAPDGRDLPVDVRGEEGVSAEDGAGADVKVGWSKPQNGRDVGGKADGLYEWKVGLPAGKKISLATEWDVKVP